MALVKKIINKVIWPVFIVEVVYNIGEIYQLFPDDEKRKYCWFIWVSDRVRYSGTVAWNVKMILVEIVAVLIAFSAWLAVKDKNFEKRKRAYINTFRLFFIYGCLEMPYYFANHKTKYYWTIYILIIAIQLAINWKELFKKHYIYK